MFQLSLQRIPGDAVAPVITKGSEAAVEFCLLGNRERELVGFKAVPQLRDQRQALGRSEAGKLVLCEDGHSYKPTTNRVGAQAFPSAEARCLLAPRFSVGKGSGSSCI